MGIVSSIKNIFKKKTSVQVSLNNRAREVTQTGNSNLIRKVILKQENPFTKVVRYFECTINIGEQRAVSKILDPNEITGDVLDFYHFADDSAYNSWIYSSALNAIEEYNRNHSNDPYDLNMPDLYSLSDIDSKPNVQKAYRQYQAVLKSLEDKCQKNNIILENNQDSIIQGIIDDIVSYQKQDDLKHGTKFDTNVGMSFSKELIDQEANRTINQREYASKEFFYVKRHLIDYYSSYFEDLTYCIQLLKKKTLSNDEKNVLKSFCELFKVIPRLLETIRYLDEVGYKVEESKVSYKKDKYRNNIDFINSIKDLIDKYGEDSLYIHVTSSKHAANSILENGLYTFSEDLSSFCFPYESIEQILSYQYGSESHVLDNYLIVFKLSSEKEIDKISDEEGQKALGKMDMRRLAVIVPPSHKVDKSHIVEIIDKKNMQVITNPQFIQGESRITK